MNRLLGGVVLLVFFISCNDKNDNELSIDHEKEFHSEIPLVRGKFTTPYTGTIWTRDFLGELDTLEFGYDSLQIRLWYEIESSRKIVVIKKNKEWKAQCYAYEINADNPDSIFLESLKMTRLFPSMGWKKFTDCLINLNILSLPDENSIPNLTSYYNRSVVNVEVATNKMYRFYSYSSPMGNVDKFGEVKV